MSSYPDDSQVLTNRYGSPKKTLPPRDVDGRFLTDGERKAESLRREASALGASKAESLSPAPIKPRMKRTMVGAV